MKLLARIAPLLIVVYICCSCGTSRKQPISYLALAYDTAGVSDLRIKERIIQKADMISIIVYSDNPLATAIYNQPVVSPPMGEAPSSASSASNPGSGYLVDDEGNIQFQGLGDIHVQGLTKREVKDTLTARLKTFLTNPYCTVRLLNYKVTVMGEVMKPNSYNIANERINILEAIGLAGDITLYGRRDNVMVVREANGKREVKRLDLRDPEIFKSDYYYLQQNDMVIVDQVRNKQQASDQVTVRNISILATIISTLAIVFSAVRR